MQGRKSKLLVKPIKKKKKEREEVITCSCARTVPRKPMPPRPSRYRPRTSASARQSAVSARSGTSLRCGTASSTYPTP